MDGFDLLDTPQLGLFHMIQIMDLELNRGPHQAWKATRMAPKDDCRRYASNSNSSDEILEPGGKKTFNWDMGFSCMESGLIPSNKIIITPLFQSSLNDISKSSILLPIIVSGSLGAPLFV